jgi:hypothetical protein
VNCAKRKLDRRSTFVDGDIVDVTEGVTREDFRFMKGDVIPKQIVSFALI